MNARSTYRQSRSTRSSVIQILAAGLLLHCGSAGTTHGTTSSDGGVTNPQPDATSPIEGGVTPPSDGSVGDSPVAPVDAGADAILPDAAEEASGGGGVAFAADRVIVTGVRGTATPTAQTVISLQNSGSTPASLTSFALSGANASLFQVTTATPATILPGATLEVTVQMTTTGTGLPALPPGPAPYDQGCNLLEATLTATLSSGSVQASVYGLLLVEYNYEPTLGQIIETLGYKLDVGQAQNNWNPNTSMMAVDLPGVEPGTDEVAAPLFVKASASSPVTMNVVARFSPVGILPYGWYPSTSSTTQNTVGTMSMVTDAQTSNKARMVYPPLVSGSATTFDPGTATFGIWVYSDQKTNTWDEQGNPVNGNYDFTQDALNTPANVHRIKSYPLTDSTGTPVPNMYMVAVEEAGNGDYQDYVFTLGNVTVAPE